MIPITEKRDVVLGLDLGTTNFKAALYSPDGHNVGIGHTSVCPSLDDGIHYELTVKSFIVFLQDCINQALVESGRSAQDIKAVSYSSQTNSFLLLDPDFNPLTPLIIWNDKRAEGPDKEYSQIAEIPDFIEQTGLGMYGALSATAKLLWFRKNRPEIWKKTSHFMSISDYLCFLLTGRNVGDASTASMLGLWSVKQNSWWMDGLEKLGLPLSLFADPLAPGITCGTITDKAAHQFSLPQGIPLALGGQDHYLAALGAGIGVLADYSESTGTVLGTISLLSEFKPVAKRVQGPGIHSDRPFYQMLFQDEGSVILKKYQEKYGEDLSFFEMDKCADEVPPGSGDIFALLKSSGFSKENNFVGQRSDSTTGQFVRAIMEAIAASFKGLLPIQDLNGTPVRILATGGGARSDVWLQIKADMLDAVMISVENQEPACKGAAMLAACAADWVGSLKDFHGEWHKVRKEFYPDKKTMEFYSHWYEKYKKYLS